MIADISESIKNSWGFLLWSFQSFNKSEYLWLVSAQTFACFVCLRADTGNDDTLSQIYMGLRNCGFGWDALERASLKCSNPGVLKSKKALQAAERISRNDGFLCLPHVESKSVQTKHQPAFQFCVQNYLKRWGKTNYPDRLWDFIFIQIEISAWKKEW